MEQSKIKYAVFILIGVVVLLIVIYLSLTMLGKKPGEMVKNLFSPALTQAPVTKETSSSAVPSIIITGKKISSLEIGSSEQLLTEPYNYQEIAKKSLSCLENLKDKRGAYLFEKKCDLKNNQCQSTESNHSGPRPIWAKFKYVQKTNDKQWLNSLINDITINSDTKIIPGIQNDFWNCKLMTEMWQSGLFNDDQKKKIHDICLYSTVSPSLVDKADQEIKSGKITNISDNIFETAYYSSEYSHQYFFTKDNNDLKRAGYFYNLADRIYKSSNNKLPFGEVCLLGEAALDMYKSTNNNLYINQAKQLWDKENISQIGVNHEFSNLTSKAICGYFANSLYQLTKDQQYQTVKREIIDILIRFDLNKNDFCYKFENIKGVNIEASLENSIVIGLLLSY